MNKIVMMIVGAVMAVTAFAFTGNTVSAAPAAGAVSGPVNAGSSDLVQKAQWHSRWESRRWRGGRRWGGRRFFHNRWRSHYRWGSRRRWRY